MKLAIDGDFDLAGWQAAKDFKEGDMSLLLKRVREREDLDRRRMAGGADSA